MGNVKFLVTLTGSYCWELLGTDRFMLGLDEESNVSLGGHPVNIWGTNVVHVDEISSTLLAAVRVDSLCWRFDTIPNVSGQFESCQKTMKIE